MSDNPAKYIAETLFPALVKSIVVERGDCDVQVTHGAASSVVAVAPHREDVGVLIGKKGKTVKSFQLIANLISAKHGWNITYFVQASPGLNPPPASRPFIGLDKEWAAGETTKMLGATLDAFLHNDANCNVSEFGSTTVYEVLLSPQEPLHNAEIMVSVPEFSDGGRIVDANHFLRGDEAVKLALNTIFCAIGKMHGRRIEVSYIRQNDRRDIPASEGSQPNTAAGRYAAQVDALSSAPMTAEQAAVKIAKHYGKNLSILDD